MLVITDVWYTSKSWVTTKQRYASQVSWGSSAGPETSGGGF